MNLTVRPLKQKDAGRRLAAIDRIAAEELGLSGGDIIRVEDRTAPRSPASGPVTPRTTGPALCASTVGFARRPTSGSTTA